MSEDLPSRRCTWSRTPSELSLADGEVHVWCAALDEQMTHLERLRTSLSPDETRRADRFHRGVDRDYFIARRGLLREILGWYFEADPAALRFSLGTHGKPALVTERSAQQMSFNLSHSRGLVLYAIALNRAVGIDLEYIDSRVECEQISSWLFAPEEHGALVALPMPQRRDAFFHCWTRKEAYIKATGRGLSQPLNAFEVTVGPDESARIVSDHGNPEAIRRWSLHDLEPAPHYAAAISVEGHGQQPICRVWCAGARAGQDAEAAGR